MKAFPAFVLQQIEYKLWWREKIKQKESKKKQKIICNFLVDVGSVPKVYGGAQCGEDAKISVKRVFAALQCFCCCRLLGGFLQLESAERENNEKIFSFIADLLQVTSLAER